MTQSNQASKTDRQQYSEEFLLMLTSSIAIANDIAGGKTELTDFNDKERAQLAEQLAQASGVLALCRATAEEQNKPPPMIEMYEKFQEAYTQMSFRAAMSSGAFEDQDEIQKYLMGVANLTAEFLHHYEVDPIEIHKAAMDLAGSKCDQPEEKTGSKSWKFWA